MSFSWLNFFTFFLWLNFFSFIISFSNLINLLIVCELFWITFFVYFSVLSNYFNSAIIFITSVYILCIATGETTIGLSILILKNSVLGSVNESDNFSKKNLKNFNSLKINFINSKLQKKWKK